MEWAGLAHVEEQVSIDVNTKKDVRSTMKVFKTWCYRFWEKGKRMPRCGIMGEPAFELGAEEEKEFYQVQ